MNVAMIVAICVFCPTMAIVGIICCFRPTVSRMRMSDELLEH